MHERIAPAGLPLFASLVLGVLGLGVAGCPGAPPAMDLSEADVQEDAPTDDVAPDDVPSMDFVADDVSSEDGTSDEATSGDATGCTSNADCDDGVFCNGLEQCDPSGLCQAGTAPTCNDFDP